MGSHAIHAEKTVTTLVQDELAYRIFIQATAQDIWDALTRPAWTRTGGCAS